MKAKREAAKPRGNRKVFDNRRRPVRVIKPEKFLARSTQRRNHDIRYKRVNRKGMQKRASNRREERTKTVAKVGEDEAEYSGRGGARTADLEDKDKKEVTYASNSVGASVVFAVRVRNVAGVPSNVKKALARLRLRHENEGVFLKYDESTRKMLHLVEPWVSYGVVSKSTTTDLINRRGHGRIEGKRVPLSDNTIIEKALGDSGIICVEDLVHEIQSASESFRTASSFLWPFRLTGIHSKFQKQKLNKKDGGDYGDCGEEMDDLIRQML
uniref:Large ribosomal subunit protein uL30-like ferredoxin-like fold domain-containing protein n=1 Tax=Pseudictyota dubia TaxID=2749911 RepID=A0A7R9VMN8_9STRA